jgi:TldD protein
VNSLDDLPSLEEMTSRCRAMVEQLVALKDAPKLESYTGPVLFEPRAAAAIFSSNFGRRFIGGQRPLGSRTTPDDFANKLGKRILPRFLSVVDDPTLSEVAGVRVLGHYIYDDQGVAARPVQLVENGKLKALVMSRNPSKEFSHSTGHGRGAYGPRASLASLVVMANPAVDASGLNDDLLEACQDEDLSYGIRVTSMGTSQMPAQFQGFDFSGFDFDFDSFQGNRGGGETPLVMYKVFPDGHEELVRGVEIARIELKAFKRILAAGDTPYVLNTGGRSAQTFCVPALLFEELDLAKMDRDFDTPPIIPSPLARTRHD